MNILFMVYIIVLSAVFVTTSMLLNPVSGIFITCLTAALTIKMIVDKKN